jgi:predicted glycosyltransferase
MRKKILIDINHPAHVHYFRNFIELIERQGYEVVLTNRNSDIINELLDHYNIKHITRNKRPAKPARWKSFLYLLGMIWNVFRVSMKVKPDFFIGFGSSACAVNSFLFGKPSIIIDDTEHNKFNHLIYSLFCTDILTPHYFEKKFKSKQIRFKAYVEQFYLHSDFFKPKEKSYQFAEYCLVRFISYDAWHDISVSKLQNFEKKKMLVSLLSKKMKVYVLSEDNDENFEEYKLNFKSNEIHEIIANAKLVISEGATIACEAGLLGVNYFYINPLQVGNINEQVKNMGYANIETLDNLIEQLKNNCLKIKKIKNLNFEENLINPTIFLLNFVLNYSIIREKIGSTIVDKKFMKDFDLLLI